MKDKLTELREKKIKKLRDYNNTPSYSWKKKLYKIELEIIDNRIKIEILKKQYR
jgi:isocitrate lyase